MDPMIELPDGSWADPMRVVAVFTRVGWSGGSSPQDGRPLPSVIVMFDRGDCLTIDCETREEMRSMRDEIARRVNAARAG